MRAVDVFPEGTHDDVHFDRAASEGRVMVGNDRHIKLMAERHAVSS